MVMRDAAPRRRFRFSLRTVFALMTVAAIFLGWFAHFLNWKRLYDVPPPVMTVDEDPVLLHIGFRYSRTHHTLHTGASDFVRYSSHADLEHFLSDNPPVQIMVHGDLADYVLANDAMDEFRRRHPDIECGFPIID